MNFVLLISKQSCSSHQFATIFTSNKACIIVKGISLIILISLRTLAFMKNDVRQNLIRFRQFLYLAHSPTRCCALFVESGWLWIKRIFVYRAIFITILFSKEKIVRKWLKDLWNFRQREIRFWNLRNLQILNFKRKLQFIPVILHNRLINFLFDTLSRLHIVLNIVPNSMQFLHRRHQLLSQHPELAFLFCPIGQYFVKSDKFLNFQCIFDLFIIVGDRWDYIIVVFLRCPKRRLSLQSTSLHRLNLTTELRQKLLDLNLSTTLWHFPQKRISSRNWKVSFYLNNIKSLTG